MNHNFRNNQPQQQPGYYAPVRSSSNHTLPINNNNNTTNNNNNNYNNPNNNNTSNSNNDNNSNQLLNSIYQKIEFVNSKMQLNLIIKRAVERYSALEIKEHSEIISNFVKQNDTLLNSVEKLKQEKEKLIRDNKELERTIEQERKTNKRKKAGGEKGNKVDKREISKKYMMKRGIISEAVEMVCFYCKNFGEVGEDMFKCGNSSCNRICCLKHLRKHGEIEVCPKC